MRVNFEHFKPSRKKKAVSASALCPGDLVHMPWTPQIRIVVSNKIGEADPCETQIVYYWVVWLIGDQIKRYRYRGDEVFYAIED
jgi:hypothetical protein